MNGGEKGGEWRSANDRWRQKEGDWYTVLGSRKRRREGERGRGAGAASGGSSRSPGNFCFRCLSSGHRSWDCRDPLICRRCRGTGHRAATFPRRKLTSPQKASPIAKMVLDPREAATAYLHSAPERLRHQGRSGVAIPKCHRGSDRMVTVSIGEKLLGLGSVAGPGGSLVFRPWTPAFGTLPQPLSQLVRLIGVPLHWLAAGCIQLILAKFGVVQEFIFEGQDRLGRTVKEVRLTSPAGTMIPSLVVIAHGHEQFQVELQIAEGSRRATASVAAEGGSPTQVLARAWDVPLRWERAAPEVPNVATCGHEHIRPATDGTDTTPQKSSSVCVRQPSRAREINRAATTLATTRPEKGKATLMAVCPPTRRQSGQISSTEAGVGQSRNLTIRSVKQGTDGSKKDGHFSSQGRLDLLKIHRQVDGVAYTQPEVRRSTQAPKEKVNPNIVIRSGGHKEVKGHEAMPVLEAEDSGCPFGPRLLGPGWAWAWWGKDPVTAAVAVSATLEAGVGDSTKLVTLHKEAHSLASPVFEGPLTGVETDAGAANARARKIDLKMTTHGEKSTFTHFLRRTFNEGRIFPDSSILDDSRGQNLPVEVVEALRAYPHVLRDTVVSPGGSSAAP
ncbi:hypothetical protein QJS10_CPA08g01030 [Acorus calamus]|uniref:CCHC-type domain-containing protein n=1 Tax=Acorus calamus TaxID=4465 RepID=A0AAV9EAW1_ACOCL|nr:hypothetical protein QJS10_CPA08g01030 [Acorus calamus]